MKKRLFSVVLAFILLLGCMPLLSFAANDVSSEELEIEQYINGDVEYQVQTLSDTLSLETLIYIPIDADRIYVTAGYISQMYIPGWQSALKITDLGKRTGPGETEGEPRVLNDSVDMVGVAVGCMAEFEIARLAEKSLQGHYIMLSFDATLKSDYEFVDGATMEFYPATYTVYVGENTVSAQSNKVRMTLPPHSHPICGASHSDVGDHTGECASIEWQPWDGTDMDTTKDGIQLTAGNYHLSKYVELSSDLEIYGTVNLCLHGMVLYYEYTYATRDRVITVTDGSSLTISDCEPTTQHMFTAYSKYWGLNETSGDIPVSGGVISGGFPDYDGGAAIHVDNGVLNMYGGNIVGSNTDYYSNRSVATDAVQVNDGTFNMYGGSIAGNYAITGAVGIYGSKFNLYNGRIHDHFQSGVYVGDGSIFNMSGGKLSENTATRGGGVHVTSGGSFVMSDGSITGNTGDASGGGVYVEGAFSMSGGRITDNASRGGAVYVLRGSTVSLSGAPVISGNLNSRDIAPCNVYLSRDTVIAAGALKDGAMIGVTCAGGGVFTSGGAEYVDDCYFMSDSADYVVAADGNNLKLTKEFTVSFVADNGTAETMDSVEILDGGEYTLPDCEFTAPTGKCFKAWSIDGSEYAAGEKITVTGDTVVTAVWDNYFEVYFNANGGDGVMEPQRFISGVEQTLAANVFTREGYDFAGWSTAEDGSGTYYADKAAVTVTESTELYAQWRIKTFTVTYKADGQTVATRTVSYGEDVTDAPAVPAKEGYSGKWDNDGKAITADTEINAVYTKLAENGSSGAAAGTTTGDNSSIALWLVLLLISAGAVIVITVFVRKRRKAESDK